MSDIIQLLPDSVANQIAAGEVIQRPASVIKELLENAVDAGSSSIDVVVKDAGKQLIQIVDNGSGMSPTDARLAFERHATSKIRTANDLFTISTMGFRGEALASIAAIAHVSLQTRTATDELGTLLEIRGSEVERQENVNCPVGSNFSIKNLFFNVPARRKFLKTNATELRHIINEFQRVALAGPQIAMSLTHNDSPVFVLPKENFRQRIVHLFGKKINQHLLPLKAETSVVSISGFVTKPENAKKRSGEQFFFVNNRYMRSAYFHSAVMKAYQGLLNTDEVPSYFIYFSANPDTIDVNIHPTKTEIKFADGPAVYQILMVAVKEALGSFNIVPSIDFETDGKPQMPYSKSKEPVKQPGIEVNTAYNPFEEEKKQQRQQAKQQLKNWQDMYDGLENSDFENETGSLFPENETSALIQSDITSPSEDATHELPGNRNYLQISNRFILTPVKSGAMLIDQQLAHQRILFEKFRQQLHQQQAASQQSLYPVTIELNQSGRQLIDEIWNEVKALGFDMEEMGNNAVVVNGTPADIPDADPQTLIENLLQSYQTSEVNDLQIPLREKLALSLAKAAAVRHGKVLDKREMQELIDNLFACENPAYTADGHNTFIMLKTKELAAYFK